MGISDVSAIFLMKNGTNCVRNSIRSDRVNPTDPIQSFDPPVAVHGRVRGSTHGGQQRRDDSVVIRLRSFIHTGDGDGQVADVRLETNLFRRRADSPVGVGSQDVREFVRAGRIILVGEPDDVCRRLMSLVRPLCDDRKRRCGTP